jgi:low-affinity ferrous iron transport protein
VEGAAETQMVPRSAQEKGEDDTVMTVNNISGYKSKTSPRLVDRWLDIVVRVAGSAPVFLLIIGGLLVWALMGIRFGNSDVWVAIISDVQAILCYVFDSFLMRQLLREYSEQRAVMAEINSRFNSNRRMLSTLHARLGPEATCAIAEICKDEPLHPLDPPVETQSLFARCMIFSARVFGHLITVGLYWVCIFIWLGFGHSCGWSNRWQLYINDATSALMVLVFAFLACLRECYADYTKTCVDAIFKLDASLELELRRLNKDKLPNSAEVILPPRESYLQVVVYYYADVIGTLVGIIILLLVIFTWAGVGPVFKFNNTWWLLIGTYAGLVGLFDSFVLRNIQGKVHKSISSQIKLVVQGDQAIFAALSMPVPSANDPKRPSLSRRVSRHMDKISSHLLMVVAGFLFTVGCIIASSAMHWSLTGQLISNVPPSIIETFFMLILITGQNDAEAQSRIDLTSVYYRRQRLLSFVKHARGFCTPEQLSEA